MTDHGELRNLPSVNDLLDHPDVTKAIPAHGRSVVRYAVRRTIDKARARALDGRQAPETAALVADVAELVRTICGESLKPMINATGVILHTNLGRAPLGPAVAKDIARIAQGYSNLEFELKTGCRGERNAHARELLKFLTGSEAVLVVNNNAAGIILALNTLAHGREIIISRGELIEIGGSFRIPEIMAASGANMVEVGTTNRTRLSDYQSAINPQTALLLKAHKSNYSIKGFTEEVPAKDLVLLAHAHGLPMMYDIGSGLLRKAGVEALKDEPDVTTAISEGADVVAFSCDKLLGGPQAGVLAGRNELIGKMALAPMMRALRVGKLTLAALAGACRQYLRDEDLFSSNPVFALLKRHPADLQALARKLRDKLGRLGIAARVVESFGQCGGGSIPGNTLRSFAVEIQEQSGIGDRDESFAEYLFKRLLRSDHPVLGVLRQGKILFDVLTVFEEEISRIAEDVAEAIREASRS